jgi:hypothetical protein
MNHVSRIARSLASLARRAVVLLACHAALPAAAAIPRSESSHWPAYSTRPARARTMVTCEPRVGARPQAPRERLRTRVLPARLPHAFQLCIHCRERPAGFWVSQTGAKTVRRPWCPSCCEGLDRDCRVIPFEG